MLFCEHIVLQIVGGNCNRFDKLPPRSYDVLKIYLDLFIAKQLVRDL